MTKRLVILTAVAVMVSLMVLHVVSAQLPLRHLLMGKLYLFEKDPDTWEIVEDGAWGKMRHNLWGPEFKFNFRAHGLEPETDYTLIYYPDPWPGENLICLGSGIANKKGKVRIKGSVDTGASDLPAEYDDNSSKSGCSAIGAKIWLVLSDDVKCKGDEDGPPKMTGWNPTEYLFEHNLITFYYKEEEERTKHRPESCWYPRARRPAR